MKTFFKLAILITSFSALGIAQSSPAPVTEATIRADMEMHVCKNDDRLEAVKSVFRKRGASDADLRVERIEKVDNLIVTKKGKSNDTIIVGAHYDKVPDGCGAIDNWTGIVVIANMYAAFKDVETEKTIVFVAFGKEELGLVGSKAMAKSIPKESRSQYCEMVNVDSFGMAYPQVFADASNSKMTKFAKELAAEVKMPFNSVSIPGADADSSAFLAKDIPSITFAGLSNRWTDYLHTSKDRIENVNHKAVLVGYNFKLDYT